MAKQKKTKEFINYNTTTQESDARKNLLESFRNSPIPDNEILYNLGLYMNRQSLSRILFMQELYKRIVEVHGDILEFGCRWGQNLALFSSFRGIFEPYNYTRKVVGFDTFSGFSSISEEDGENTEIREGHFSVSQEYESYLEDILTQHEQESPISNIKKFQLVSGDVSLSLPKYFEESPESIVALAYFDLDLYEPTLNCLKLLKGRLTKGSVIGFDELNLASFPGETLALKDALGLENIRIQRVPFNPATSYFVID